MLCAPLHEDYLGFTIIDTQIFMAGNRTRGTADILAEDEEGELWLLDLKLTKDIESDPKFNPFSWKDINSIDPTQMVYYQTLYSSMNDETPRCGYLIFDYTEHLRVRFYEVVITEEKQAELFERVDRALDVADGLDGSEDLAIPSKGECDKCVVQCSRRFDSRKIIRKKATF